MRPADTAPCAIATSITGCWHLYEAMARCPFSRMNYISLSVLSALVALWAYMSMERGLRSAWLDKAEAAYVEQRLTLATHLT